MKTRTPSMLKKPITAVGDWSLLTVVVTGLAMLVFSPVARAQCNQGCSGSNTFLGEEAMPDPSNNDKTAIGWLTLQDVAAGDDNTAVGSDGPIWLRLGHG